MNGKEEYQNIQISEKLDEVFENACQRGRRKKTYDKVKGIASVAAVVALTFIISNVPVTYAALSEIPVVGSLVKVLHVGSGGSITDGVGVYQEASVEGLKIWFLEENEWKNKAPFYHITYKQAPNRIEILLSGVRNFDAKEWVQQAEAMEGIKKAYREIYLDDSAILFVLELEQGIGYKAEEFENPAYLQLTFAPEEKLEEQVYFIRTKAMQMGEELALLKENYAGFEPSIARTQTDDYILTVGNYKTEEEAKEALAELERETTAQGIFTIDNCSSQENPK